jgi:hypothetical protein
LVLDSHEDVGFIHPNARRRMIFEYLDGFKSSPWAPLIGKVGARWVTSEVAQIALSFKNGRRTRQLVPQPMATRVLP